MVGQLAAGLKQGDKRAEKAVKELLDQGIRDADKRMYVGIAALIYLDAQRFQEAADAYEKAIRLDPKNPAYHADSAIAYESLGRLDKAIAEAETSVRLDPQNPLNFFNLGQYYLERGDIPRGRDTLTKSIALAQSKRDGDTATKAKNWLQLLSRMEQTSPKEIQQYRDQLLNEIATANKKGDGNTTVQGMKVLRFLDAFEGRPAVKSSKGNTPTRPSASKKPVTTQAVQQGQDLVRLKNGNEIEGTITAQNDKEITIDVPGVGAITLTRADIASIAKRTPNSTAQSRLEALHPSSQLDTVEVDR